MTRKTNKTNNDDENDDDDSNSPPKNLLNYTSSSRGDLHGSLLPESLATTYYKNQLNILLAESNTTKYSFNKLQINGANMMLSVYKTPRLPNDLLRIKSNLGIPLIQFENARIEFKPFILLNEHDTASCLLNLISKHYR